MVDTSVCINYTSRQRSKDKDRDKTEDAPPGYCRSFQLDDETEASDSTLVAKVITTSNIGIQNHITICQCSKAGILH